MNYLRQMKGDTLVIADENGEKLLSIKETVQNNCMLFEVSGNLKNEIAYEFEDELTAVLTIQHNVRIDLSKLEFIASAGLRTLLTAQQFIDETSDGSLIICGISSKVLSVFEENGFAELFQFDLPNGGSAV